MPISISNRTQKRLPRVKFEPIAGHILGKNFELSLVFCGDTLMRRLNRTYRGKDRPTNVLSFPISKTSGEIFIDLSYLKRISVSHLFIHACLHLKGMQHGSTMELEEQKLLNVATNRNWH